MRHSALRSGMLVGLVAATAGCGQAGGDVDGEQLPPAAALSPSGGALTLEQKLAELDQTLGVILQTELSEESRPRVYRAEAVTDRLLEDEPPVAWLATGYDVEARLRQIQALADRIVAQMRRDVDRAVVLEDVAALHYAVRDLRTQLASEGGGRRPPPLDSLLAGAAEARTPAAPTSSPAASTRSTPAGTETTAPTGEPAAEEPEPAAPAPAQPTRPGLLGDTPD